MKTQIQNDAHIMNYIFTFVNIIWHTFRALILFFSAFL